MKKALKVLLLLLLLIHPISALANEIELGQPTEIHVKKGAQSDLVFSDEETFELSEIEWVNYNDEVAEVNFTQNKWVVKGLDYGSARLIGSIEGVPRISILVQVFDSMVFLNLSSQIDINETIEDNLVFQPATQLEDFNPSYQSDNPSIASVDENGIITGHQLGKVQITATYLGQSAVKEVEVIDRPDFAYIDKKLVINVDSSVNIPYRLSLFGPNVDKTITWSSQNENIASVDQNGTVYGHDTGSTNIKAYVNGNEYLLVVEVIKSIESISLGRSQVEINTKENYQIDYRIFPQQYADTPITWSSSRPSVARVRNGLVNGISVGETIITAKIDDIEAQMKVIVNEPLTGINVSPSRLTLQQTQRFHLRVSPVPSTSNTPLELSYTSSDPQIVSVDDFGNVTAQNQGKAYIFVEHENYTTSVEVQVVFAQDDDGLNKMIGSLNNNQVVTFDLRGVEDVSNFVLEIPQVTRRNNLDQYEVNVQLSDLVLNENQFIAHSLQLSEWYQDKDIHVKVVDPNNVLLFDYQLYGFTQPLTNLVPTTNLIQSRFNNVDNHLIELNLPISLRNLDSLTLNSRIPVNENFRIYEDINDNLRIVDSKQVSDQTSNIINLSRLSAKTYYLTDESLQSRIAPFLFVIIGLVSLFTSFFVLKRYNEQSIKEEIQERSRHESINYQQSTSDQE